MSLYKYRKPSLRDKHLSNEELEKEIVKLKTEGKSDKKVAKKDKKKK